MIGNGKVFISHTHMDNAACDPLLAAFDAWQVDYWFDLEQLSAGQEFPARIEQSIASRDILLRVLTPAASQSAWMAREVTHARSLQGRRGARQVINLLLQPGYALSPQERHEIVIDATTQPEADWLRQLRRTLGIPSRERRVNRRTVLGLGVAGAAAVAATAVAGKLLLFPDVAQAVFSPTTRAATATPQPGAPPAMIWRYRYWSSFGRANLTAASGAIFASITTNDLNDTILRLNSATGARQWFAPHGVPDSAAPVTQDGALYLLATNSSDVHNIYLLALDAATGTERWRSASLASTDADTFALSFSSTVALSAGLAIVRWEDTLAAIDAATGAIQWKVALSAAAQGGDYQFIVSTPVIAGDVIYAGLDDGSVAALALQTGQMIWRSAVASQRLSSAGLVAGGVLYIGSEDGNLYALDAATGALRWKQSLTPFTPPNAGITSFVTSQPVLAGGVLYIGSGAYLGDLYNFQGSTTQQLVDDNLLALDPATGKVLWTAHPSLSAFPYATWPLSALGRSGVRAAPLVAGDTIYVTSFLSFSDTTGAPGAYYKDTLYALDRATGATKWTYVTAGSGSYPSDPVLTPEGVLAFGSSDDLIVAFRP